MAYYTALIAAWNGATQPPAGVTGTAITAGMTAAQKLDAVNSWMIVGTLPTSLYVTGNQILNCINYAEFKALTAQQQSNLLHMCQVGGQLLGGSANVSFMVSGMIVDYFPLAGPTIAALTALAKGVAVPWWQVPVSSGGGGLAAPVSMSDVVNAGLSGG